MTSDMRTAADDAELARIRTVYDAETDRLIQQRLGLTACLFLLLVGCAVVIESALYPDRARTVMEIYLLEAVACGLALAAMRSSRVRLRPGTIAAILTAVLASLVSEYLALVGGDVERLATAQVCLLSGLVVMLPWGWRPQALVSASVFGNLAISIPHLGATESVAYSALALLTGSVSSVFGAYFLDRYRFDAFVRTAMLDEAKRRTEEEAEVTASLLHVGQYLAEHVGGANLLEHVNRLTAEVLGAEYSATYIWDARAGGFRLQAGVGATPDIHAEAEEIVLTHEGIPLLLSLAPGRVTEIPSAIGNGPVLDALLRRWGVSSALAAPICRGHDVAGVLVASWRNRTGAFGPRAHRLILGVAHTVAVTLENARLIGDLQAANTLKTEFVSTMSHELRTPLNVILGYTDMARDDRMPEDDWRTCLDRIDAAGRELLELIEDTLEIGRIEAGRDEVRLETVALPTFWTGLGDTCRRMPRRDGVRLEWGTAPVHGALVTDPRKLTVVVRNLVGNALKFTEAGLVRCDVTTRGDEVTLRVADTGIGIPPEQQGAIFEMFRQVDGSDRRRYGGAGLGLYITRRFVEQLGGRITVESAPGIGSTFVVTLPIRQSQPPARRAA